MSNVADLENNIGGLVGKNNGMITHSYSSVHIRGEGYIGGLVGNNSGAIEHCYAKGYVNDNIYTYHAGGLVGYNSGDIVKSYSTGRVFGDKWLGGLVGTNAGSIVACFWDMETSQMIIGIGVNTGTPAEVYGKTTSEMKEPNTFTSHGWDFTEELLNGAKEIWYIEQDGVNYPDFSRHYYAGGIGTRDNPFRIQTAAQLDNISRYRADWFGVFLLEADIDLSGYVYREAVISPDESRPGYSYTGTHFQGTFDGQGHRIMNLTIDTLGVDENYVGFFGNINQGEVRNLGFDGAQIITGDGSDYVGILAGHNYSGILSENYTDGCVSGGDYMGGLVGLNDGPITYCYATVSITGSQTSERLGGIVGSNHDVIHHCYAAGPVIGGNYLGGLVGYSSLSSYTKSFWDNTVNGGLSGIGNITDPNVIGETTENMHKQATFTDVGWDFAGGGGDEIWKMSTKTGYPTFNWNIEILGDIIGRIGVDMADFSALATVWMSTPSDDNWNTLCDLHKNNIIDIRDLQILLAHWLEGR